MIGDEDSNQKEKKVLRINRRHFLIYFTNCGKELAFIIIHEALLEINIINFTRGI